MTKTVVEIHQVREDLKLLGIRYGEQMANDKEMWRGRRGNSGEPHTLLPI